MRRFFWAFCAFGWGTAGLKIAQLFSHINLYYAGMGVAACIILAVFFAIRAVDNSAWGDGL